MLKVCCQGKLFSLLPVHAEDINTSFNPDYEGVLRAELRAGDADAEHDLPPGVGGPHQPRGVPGRRPHQESLPRPGPG